MSQYFPKPYESFGGDINVKFDLSNYATETDLKNISHIDVSSYALKTNLAGLKSEVDKIDTDKLKTVPDDLAKLSNLVKNDAVKKTDYNTLKTKVDAIDVSKYVSRTKYEKDGSDFEDNNFENFEKIPDISNLATKSRLLNYYPQILLIVKLLK